MPQRQTAIRLWRIPVRKPRMLWQNGRAGKLRSESFETMAADHAEELQEQNSDGEEIQYIYEDATEEDLDDSISSWCFDEAKTVRKTVRLCIQLPVSI